MTATLTCGSTHAFPFFLLIDCRRHGFQSVGKLASHSPLGQLLLHGLQLLLGMAFDGDIRLQLERRLGG
jgi:hypothetical protein